MHLIHLTLCTSELSKTAHYIRSVIYPFNSVTNGEVQLSAASQQHQSVWYYCILLDRENIQIQSTALTKCTSRLCHCNIMT